MIDLTYSLSMAFSSLTNSKLRSALTMIGIIIGIASVIATVSLGNGFTDFFNDQMSSTGTNRIMVMSMKDDLLHDQQVEIIKNTNGVSMASPILSSRGVVEYMGETKNMTIYGVTEDYEEINTTTMLEGSFISDKDTYTVIIDQKVAEEEFRNIIGPGTRVKITLYDEDGISTTQSFSVKGITESPSFVRPGTSSEAIYIPIEKYKELTGKEDYRQIVVRADSAETMNETEDELRKNLFRDLGISLRNYENNSTIPITFMNQAELTEQANTMINTVKMFLIAIGGISLIVGAVGIMNIMIVTVTERTKEIGTLKALGYASKDILSLFLIESIVISGLGGAIGALFGLGISYAGASFIGITPDISISLFSLGVGIAVVIGVIAGVFPAKRAADMNPVDALRAI